MNKVVYLILLLLFGARLNAQDKLYERGSLSLGMDIGASYNLIKATYAGYLSKDQGFAPTTSILLDYKFVKNPFGLNSGVQFDFYTYEDIQLQYLSIPLQGNIRFGKKVEFLMAAGISNNFRIAFHIDPSRKDYDLFMASKKLFAIGLIANIEGGYKLPNGKHKISLNVGYAQMLNSQFETWQAEKIGQSNIGAHLSSYRFALGYKYTYFTKKSKDESGSFH